VSVHPFQLIDLISLVFGVEGRAGMGSPIRREVYRNNSHSRLKIDMLSVHHQRQVPNIYIYIYIYIYEEENAKNLSVKKDRGKGKNR